MSIQSLILFTILCVTIYSSQPILLNAIISKSVIPPSPPSPSPTAQPQLLPISSWANKRVMMIAAHPDDIEACVGGTIAMLTQQGTKVRYVIATNGDKGCSNPLCTNMTAEQIAEVRQQEAIAAAAVLNVPANDVILLDYEDAMLTSYPEVQIREQFVTAIRQFQPHVIMTWYPYPRFELRPANGWDDLGYHPDHQRAAKIAMDSSFNSGVARLFPLAGDSWSVEEFYMWEFVHPSHYTVIDSVMSTKIKSFLAHASQYPNQTIVQQEVEFVAQQIANAVPGISGQFAEGFLAFF